VRYCRDTFLKYLRSFIIQAEIHLSNVLFFMPDFIFHVIFFGIVSHRSIAARHFCPHIDFPPPRGVKTQPPSNIGAILDSLAGEISFLVEFVPRICCVQQLLVQLVAYCVVLFNLSSFCSFIL
jgi:hypothetical protein